jgi:carboxyl-terminal processing protease
MASASTAATENSKENLEEGLNCNFIFPIEQAFLNQHILGLSMDDKLRDRVVDQYIKKLDATKIYFTQADVEQVKKMLSKVLEQMKNHDCVSLLEVQKMFVKRAQDRADYAKKTLDAKFKVDNNVEFEFDPDKRPFSKTQDEINEFMRKYLHFQVSNYLATDMKLEEAKSTVIKNYERLVKRIAEKKNTDIYADYLDCFARSLDPHSNFFSHEAEEEITHVAFYEKPLLTFERLLETYIAFAPKGLPSFLKAMPVWITEKLWIGDTIKKNLEFK